LLGFIEENKNLSRKERERLLKKAEIINSGIKLFACNGYEGTTLEDIAEAAEFGKGTIYNYFSNKEELFISIIDEITKNHLRILADIDSSESTFLGFITKLTKEMLRFLREDYYSFLLLVRTKTDMNAVKHINNSKFIVKYFTESRNIFDKQIKSAIKNKEINEINTDSFMILYRSIIFSYFYSIMNYCELQKTDMAKEGEFILSVLFNGIKAKK